MPSDRQLSHKHAQSTTTLTQACRVTDISHTSMSSHRQLSHKYAESAIDTNLFLQTGLELDMWEILGLDAGRLIHWATTAPTLRIHY